ncbi:NAD(P)H nitroreductase [Planotetraspora thailandica]|uniref:NAD(P)H nitroreductase n=1 Tax=Planotetraspora thailandica TaxID=487172 RepID=A0A8J3V062_9ACTN|nr:nitroreductase family protein [Planotetraspora thailandica]GII54176.1 NAD(P)H nitroreductase [Planotetraspora thailandica]
MNTWASDAVARVTRAAVDAAVWAPSVHNTQPWSFAISGDEISLRADTDRKLRVADAAGRQMLISCGAALFNVRITLSALGYEPEVRPLPDPDRPSLLATVRPRTARECHEEARSLHAEIERRRTHRAGFTALPVPGELVETLVAQARTEDADLMPVRSESAVRVLEALTTAAQEVESHDRAFSMEVMRWSRPAGSTRRDGVQAGGRPAAPGRTWPQHFAQRDFTRGHPWGEEADQPLSTATGLVAVLTTPGDTREDWLAAGQALQHVLLHASAYGLSAAFHTQALEMPQLREFIRRHLTAGAFPQMIMRLGFALDDTGSVRRPSSEVLDDR